MDEFNIIDIAELVKVESPIVEKPRFCNCGNCNGHDEIILNISGVIPDYIDFNSDIIIPGCCGSCAILDAVKEALDNELKVDEDITDTSCFPEIPLENATYIFTMSITGVPDYFTGCFDVDTEYELKKVIK